MFKSLKLLIIIYHLLTRAIANFVLCGNNETSQEQLIRELSKPLRLGPLKSNTSPDFSDLKLNSDFQVYDTVFNNTILGRLLLSYIIMDHIEYCGFKYKYNKVALPMLVRRREIIGSLICKHKDGKEEYPVLSFCFGEIQLAYPFYPSNYISLKKKDIFLIQSCIIKYPDYNGIPYRYPKIPENQLNIFNSTMFDSKFISNLNFTNSTGSYFYEDINNRNGQESSNFTNDDIVIKYQLKKKYLDSECVISRLYSGQTFEVIGFSIIGTITCQTKIYNKNSFMQDSYQRVTNRDIIRSLCTGIATFNAIHSNYNFGIFKFNHHKPFLSIKCASIPEEIFNYKILNPDQAIKDIIFSIRKQKLG
ncbi:hypothetical protein FG386_003296 [Cryptosporidium ryanae]|uniref:uncharacterized protein n=1 Tax=Cryptosporidium ryanae TaxID=515981 RepID=UPI00351AB088|nr:hypothetical protein FG386_003296 [Cryptosporidium ryanae]